VRRVVVLLPFLLFGVSGLLFGAWWMVPGPESADHATTDLLDRPAPKLVAGAQKPVTPDEEAKARIAAKHLLDELRQMDEKAQTELLGTRVRVASPWVVPFSEELVLYLIGLLASEDSQLPNYAAMYLRRMGARVAPFLFPLLASDATEVTKVRALTLIDGWRMQGAAPAMPALLPLLDDELVQLQNVALRIVNGGVPYDAQLAQRLLAMLREKPTGSMFGPGTGLARMGPPGVALLVGLTGNGEARERVAAFHGLSQARGQHLKPHLAHFALHIADANEDPGLRIAAILALRALEGDCLECLQALRDALSEKSYDLANPALTVLTQMGPRAAAAVPDLLPWLDETDPKQADRTAATLGAIRSRPDLVLPALAGLITRQGSDDAAKAMGAYGPVAFDHALRVLDEGDEYARYSILWTFATLGERAAAIVPRLIPLINGDDPDISLRVVGTLGFIGLKASAAVPAIMERLAQGAGVLHARAAGDTLIRMGKPAEDALVAALRSSNETARRQALRVLTRFHVRSAFALEGIGVMAQAKDARVRGDAIEAAAVALFDPQHPGVIYPPARDRATVARVRAILERGQQDKDETVRARAAYYFGLVASLEGRK